MFTEELHSSFLNEAKKITISRFLDKVRQYPNLDAALISLPAEYMEFFMDNEKKLQRALGKLFESAEDPGYLGWSPPEKKIVKVIKYKGNILHLNFDPDNRHWVPIVAFRSVTQALKHGKRLVDESLT